MTDSLHDIMSGIRDISRESSNIAQNIDTIITELETIKRKYKGEEISKGDYEIIKGPIIEKGTIYSKYESSLLKDLLDIKVDYWNPNWDFISWKELFSKIDKINSILSKIDTKKEELEEILLKSSEIKTKLDAIIKNLHIPL